MEDLLHEIQNVQRYPNWPCLTALTLIDLNDLNLCYYQFIVGFDRFVRSGNTRIDHSAMIFDLSGRICVSNNTKNVKM